ncbi:hypothetical protein BsWGS_11590 [Bradybaena similaris]
MGSICAKKTPAPAPIEEDPTPDPFTGLTQRQRNLLKQSWQDILRNSTSKEAGAKLLLKLFEKAPNLNTYYHEYPYNDISELQSRASFRAQAVSIVMRASAYIDCADDPEILTALIGKHSFAHLNHVYSVQDLVTFKEVFLEFVKEECGSDATPELMEAWEKFLTFHNNCFITKSEQPGQSSMNL